MKNNIAEKITDKITSIKSELTDLMEKDNQKFACNEFSIAIEYLKHIENVLAVRLTRRMGEDIDDDSKTPDTRFTDRKKSLKEKIKKNQDFISETDRYMNKQKEILKKDFSKWEERFKITGTYLKYTTAKREIAEFEEKYGK